MTKYITYPVCHNFAGNNEDGYYNKSISYVYPFGDT